MAVNNSIASPLDLELVKNLVKDLSEGESLDLETNNQANIINSTSRIDRNHTGFPNDISTFVTTSEKQNNFSRSLPIDKLFEEQRLSKLGSSSSSSSATTNNTNPIVLVVNTTADQNDGGSSGGFSLRDAIITANNNPNQEHIIQIQGGQTYNLSIAGTNENNGLTGDLDIDSGANVTIRATGNQRATINGNNLDRVFHVQNNGALTIDNVKVTGGLSDLFGGGIYNEQGDLVVKNSAVTGNQGTFGGGINSNLVFGREPNLTIINSEVSNNRSVSTTSSGGGGIFATGNFTIRNTRIIGNTVAQGNGGGAVFSGEGTVSNSLIKGNILADGSAGGFINTGKITVSNTIISQNVASGIAETGGGIVNGGVNTELTLIGSRVISNEAGSGGGFFNGSGKVTVRNSFINGNKAFSGGGVYQDTNGETTLINVTVNNNIARSQGVSGGGGIFNQGSEFSISGGEIIGNRSQTDGGGVANLTDMFVLGTEISDNSSNGKGGAFYLRRGVADLFLLNSLVDNNFARDDGGAIQVDGDLTSSIFSRSAATLIVANSTLSSNQTFGDGGAINNDGELVAINSTIAKNRARGNGGGVAVRGGVALPINCIDNNFLTCGFANADAATAVFISNTVTNNSTTNGQGAGLFNTAQSVNMNNPGVDFSAGSAGGFNNIFANNNGADIDGAFYGSFNLIENASQASISGNNNLTGQDPALKPLQDNGGNSPTQNLQTNSVAIDAGNKNFLLPDILDLDQDGNMTEPWAFDQNNDPRIVGQNIDLGATELQVISPRGLNLRGTTRNDTLRGGALNDTLIGLADNDLLLGNDGRDILTGNAGNDVLNGGAKADRMNGGTGNDSYIVDNISDRVIERLNQGRDLVRSSISYTLPNHVENLTLIGTADRNGIGNALANRITGNGGRNTLNGNAGNDILTGNGGNDLLNGGAGNDRLIAGGGNDTLVGGNGRDILTGGGNNDSFRFNSRNETGVDRITDYSLASDRILIRRAGFNAGLTTGALPAFKFTLGNNATTANHRFIYNAAQDNLFFDPDGNGNQGKILIASFNNVTLNAQEIIVI